MKTIKKPIVVILSVCILMSVFSTSVFADKKKEPVDGRTYRKGVNMVSMGDSFASGESIGSYGTGSVYDEDFLAHRSYYSWSSLLKLPGNGGGRMRDYKGTKWQFVACSGATTENIYGTQTKEYNHNGQKGSHDLPPQLDIFSSGKIDPKEVDYVTLSIGGNDVDFVFALAVPPTVDVNLFTRRTLIPLFYSKPIILGQTIFTQFFCQT